MPLQSFESRRFNLRQVSDFDDFCGEYKLDFSSINPDETRQLIELFAKGAPYSEMLALFLNDLDRFAQTTTYIFSLGKITREQASSMLEFRAMKKHFLNVKQVPFLNDDNEFSNEALKHLPQFIASDSQSKFLELLKAKPLSEHCYYELTIPPEHLERRGIIELLEIANLARIIKKAIVPLPQRHSFESEYAEPTSAKPNLVIYYFSVGARNAVTEAIFEEHTKSLFPRLGAFSKDDIAQSMMNNGRYSALSYPGIADETSFHSTTNANSFYLGLHDEAHRRLISTIPNIPYEAFLYAIDIVRTKSNIDWSKEVWDGMDMEIGAFLNETQNLRNDTSIQTCSESFLKMLASVVYTQDREIALFQPSPFSDTTWLLLIDMVLNAKKWKSLSVDPSLFPDHSKYKSLYDFVEKHKNEIENVESSATQVAIIKAKYFNLPSLDAKEIKFIKRESFIELSLDGKPLITSKALSLDIDINVEEIIENLNLTNDDFNFLFAAKNLGVLNSTFSLIKENKLTSEMIKFMATTNDRVSLEVWYSFIQKEQYSLDDFQAIPQNKLEHLENLYLFIIREKISLVDFISFSNNQLECLHKKFYSLIRYGHVTLDEFKTLSDDNLRDLLSLNHFLLLSFPSVLTIEQFKLLSDNGVINHLSNTECCAIYNGVLKTKNLEINDLINKVKQRLSHSQRFFSTDNNTGDIEEKPGAQNDSDSSVGYSE